MPARVAVVSDRRGARPVRQAGDALKPAETLWQLKAGGQAAMLIASADLLGHARVTSTPDLLHYMNGWLVDDVARYARQWGWRLAFVA